MEATLTFEKRNQAEQFAKAWSRKTLSGHTIMSGNENVKVHIYDITDDLIVWIDSYVSEINKTIK